jgi:hypothetical protein
MPDRGIGYLMTLLIRLWVRAALYTRIEKELHHRPRLQLGLLVLLSAFEMVVFLVTLFLVLHYLSE